MEEYMLNFILHFNEADEEEPDENLNAPNEEQPDENQLPFNWHARKSKKIILNIYIEINKIKLTQN
jgi:hypothetical protein